MSELSTYPLRLPGSIRAGVAQMAQEDGISINQFVSIAVAEKLALIQAETFFAARRGDSAMCCGFGVESLALTAC